MGNKAEALALEIKNNISKRVMVLTASEYEEFLDILIGDLEMMLDTARNENAEDEEGEG